MNKIIYLDAAASSLKPRSVIETEMNFLSNNYANAGRGVCARAMSVDNMVADSRAVVANFINANPEQIVFTSGATDGLNRVVNLARQMSKNKTPVVAVSDLDHHSCRLPWENLASGGCANIVVMPLNERFDIDLEKVPYADILIITAMSNVMGTPQDVEGIVRAAHVKNPNVVTVVDAAQYIAHLPIDVKKWDCDFICASGHKIGADTGVGFLYIRNADNLLPDKFGGGMVLRVMPDGKFISNNVPERFEAGTLPLTQIVGLKCAIDWLKTNRADSNLIPFLYDRLTNNSRINIITSRDAYVFTFVVDGMHVLDFGTLVGAHGICLRVGNMCATWINRRLGVDGTIRISVGPWNTMDEMQQTVNIINSIVK